MQNAHIAALELREHPAIRTINTPDMEALVRASRTLHRWSELECGDGNDYASWAIERDEQTGKPYFVTYPHQGKSHRRPIADRERGALKRIAAVCASHGMNWYYQTDCRGLALYVSPEPLNDSNYNRGVAIG